MTLLEMIDEYMKGYLCSATPENIDRVLYIDHNPRYPPAGSQAYLLAELPERILVYSTSFDILVSTAVSTYFGDLVETSPRLRAELLDILNFEASAILQKELPQLQLNKTSNDPWHFAMLNGQ